VRGARLSDQQMTSPSLNQPRKLQIIKMKLSYSAIGLSPLKRDDSSRVTDQSSTKKTEEEEEVTQDSGPREISKFA